MKYCVLIYALLFCINTQASTEFSYSHGSSESSLSNKFKIATSLLNQSKFSLYYNNSKSTDANPDEDANTHNIKLSLKTRISGGIGASISFKKTDDAYFFSGNGLDLKANYTLESFISDELNTNFGFKLDRQNKLYSKNQTYDLSITSISFDVSQDLLSFVNIGASFTSNAFTSKNAAINKLLFYNDSTDIATDSDIYKYILIQSANSQSYYIELEIYSLILGYSYGIDQSLIEGEDSYTNSEFYIDYETDFDININYSQTRSRAESSTSYNISNNIGLSYTF